MKEGCKLTPLRECVADSNYASETALSSESTMSMLSGLLVRSTPFVAVGSNFVTRAVSSTGRTLRRGVAHPLFGVRPSRLLSEVLRENLTRRFVSVSNRD